MRRLFSVAAVTVPLAIYIVTLVPGVGFWDTAEMQTVPYIFGVAHPPGFPVFVILGYVFSHLFAIGNVAWRLSLMSALAMAGAAWFVFRTLESQDVHPALACLCAWAFAFGDVAWTRGTRAEVHALALFFIAAAIYGALRANTMPARSGINALYLCALSLGLAAATHPVVIWVLPGIAVLLASPLRALWRSDSASKPRPARVALTALCFAAGPMLLYLYMPLRSAFITAHHLDPSFVLGLPPGQPFWDYGHTVDLHRFILQITGAQFPKGEALRAVTNITAYPAFAATLASKALGEFGILMLLLAIAGVIGLFFRNATRAAGLLLVTLAGVPFALSYLIEIDYDRYLLTAYWGIAIFAGIGAQTLLSLTQSARQRHIALALLSLVLLESVAYDFKANRNVWAQRSDRSGQAFIDRTLRETEPGSIIDAPWVFEAPLAYAAYVDQRVGGRTIESSDPTDTDSRLGIWIKQRPVYVIFFETGPPRLPGLRFVPVDLRTPALYRVVARR
jgi:hypothetical protein